MADVKQYFIKACVLCGRLITMSLGSFAGGRNWTIMRHLPVGCSMTSAQLNMPMMAEPRAKVI